MAKLTTDDLSNLTNETTAVATINANFAAVETAMENTLSRDGTSPNSMSAQLDMNSYKIVNLATPTANTDAATKAYVDSVAATDDLGSLTGYVTDAQTAATNAASSATSAAASAAKLSGTSTTSLAIGTGSKTFTTQASKFFDAGTWVLITSDADPNTNYMHGQVTSYSSTTLVVNVTNIGGAGTLADWTIRVSGTRGATGSATIDINGSTEVTSLASDDEFIVYDTSAGANRKITASNVFEGVNNLTAETAPATDDVILLYDTSASTADKMTVADLLTAVNSLTEDTSPVQSADYVQTYDTSASAAKKVLLNKLGVGLHTVGFSAGGLFPSTSNGCDALTQRESTTHKVNYKALPFSNQTGTTSAWCWIPTPKGITAGSSLTSRLTWTADAGGDVVWQVEMIPLADGDTIDTAFSTTAVSATDTVVSGQWHTIAVAACTPASLAKQDWVGIRLSRVGGNGADTLAGTAYLIGAEFYYTSDTNTDD